MPVRIRDAQFLLIITIINNSILLYTSSFYLLCHNAFDQNLYVFIYTYVCVHKKKSDKINEKIKDEGRE